MNRENRVHYHFYLTRWKSSRLRSGKSIISAVVAVKIIFAFLALNCMAQQYINPGVLAEEITRYTASISPATTSVTAFIGWSPMGPTDHGELIKNWENYADIYGGLDSQSLLSYSVYNYFINGGKKRLFYVWPETHR